MSRNYFFTSDLHLSHANVIRYSNRPFSSVDEMNETIIENWNSVVKQNDVVYILGDVSFEKDQAVRDSMLKRLKGEKHLITGNHDKGLLKTGWQKHFVSMADLRTVNIPDGSPRGQKIVLCHYAMRTWEQSHYGVIQLHGHSHGMLPDDPDLRQIDVGVDCWNFTPISLAQVNEAIATRKNPLRPLSQR